MDNTQEAMCKVPLFIFVSKREIGVSEVKKNYNEPLL